MAEMEFSESARVTPLQDNFDDEKYCTYRIEGHGLEPRFVDREYVTTSSSVEHAEGREMVIRRNNGRSSIAFCGDVRATLPDVLEASVVIGRSLRPFAAGEIFPLLAPMPVATTVRNDTGEPVDLVEPYDRRLAVRGPRLELDAWFEDRMNDDPVSIVITSFATDERLTSLASKFQVPLAELIRFRDELLARETSLTIG